jgi:microcystin degradation protein MlrC
MPIFTVLTAELQHETNTFCVLPTTYDRFTDRGVLIGAAAIAARAQHNTTLAGFMDASQAYAWKVEHVLSADAPPGGCVTRDTFERLVEPIVAAAKALQGQLHGILLGLHGAMVTELFEDGEGELLRRLREQVGPILPIAITLDPHANVSRAMCDCANIIVSFKTYPHVDMRLTGRHAGDILQRTMAGEIHPITLRVKRPMLEEASGGRTDVGPMVGRMAQARAYEQMPDVFAVSVNAGFANADVAEMGPTVLVTAQGNMEQHAHFASALADGIWAGRSERLEHFLSVVEAAVHCKAYAADPAQMRPIVVADYADNPGGGAYGDSTALLQALLAQGVGLEHANGACFGPMVDAETVLQLQNCKIGDQVNIQLGGKTDPRFGGGQLALRCTLKLLGNGDYVGSGVMQGGLARSWGPMAVIVVDGIDILVVTQRAQLLDLAQFKTFGIDPAHKRVVALKSMQHFRAAFEPIAGKVIVCDSGALCTLDYTRLPFTCVPRPVFPLDMDFSIDDWRLANAQGVYIPAAMA